MWKFSKIPVFLNFIRFSLRRFATVHDQGCTDGIRGPSFFWSSPKIIIRNEETNKIGSGVVQVTLNRPERLNALDLDMVMTLRQYIRELSSDDRCRAIIVSSNNDKAFCAGGDLRYLYHSDGETRKRFFALAYSLNHEIAKLKKPVISVWKGIVMGGGVGLSIHGRYRIATENVCFCMPETQIGLFPDAGIQYMFSRLPNQLGCYLGLTGANLNALDVIRLGFATHYVPSDKINDLLEKVKESISIDDIETDEKISSILREYEDKTELYKLSPHLTDDKILKINNYFSGTDSFKQLMTRLKDNSSDIFIKETVDTISLRCPLSCAVWFCQHKLGHNLSLSECIRSDFLISQSLAVYDNYNFEEGIRAHIIRKDRNPKWKPDDIENVDDEYLDEILKCPRGYNLEI